jgi:glycosyltransferase involved in cell wall biosynthesis
VEVTGHLRDVDAYFDSARVFIAPLRYGAGMKGKCGHAFSRGLPIVTTSLGAEGFGITDGRQALLRDDAASFADAVMTLLQDDGLWEAMSAEGLGLIRDHLTPEHMRDRLDGLLANCLHTADSSSPPDR